MHTSSFSPCFPSSTMDPDSHDSTETISHQVYENSRWTNCRPGALLAVVCRILSFSYRNNIHILVICTNKVLWKWSGLMTGLKMSKNVANVQRRTLKDLQRAWKTITQDHFKTFWKQKIKKRWRAHKFKQHSSFWLNWQSNWGSRNLFASVSHNITSHNQGKRPSSLSFLSWSYILLTFCQTLIIFYFTPVHCICERSLNLNLPWRS